MISETTSRRSGKWPVYIASTLLIVFAGVFVLIMIQMSDDDRGVPDEELADDTYMDIVGPLLVDADPSRAPDLLQKHGCNACHSGNNAGRFAPDFAETRRVAGERHPPLGAQAYVYESIVYPGAYVVEGFQNNMPRTYGNSIPDDELGAIIAYLSSQP